MTLILDLSLSGYFHLTQTAWDTALRHFKRNESQYRSSCRTDRSSIYLQISHPRIFKLLNFWHYRNIWSCLSLPPSPLYSTSLPHPPRHPVLSLPLSQSWYWTFVFHFFDTHKPNFELTTLNWKTRFNASHDPLPLEDMEDESTQLLFVTDPPLRFEFCVHWENLSLFARDAHPHIEYLFFNLSSLFSSFNWIRKLYVGSTKTTGRDKKTKKWSSFLRDPIFAISETCRKRTQTRATELRKTFGTS